MVLWELQRKNCKLFGQKGESGDEKAHSLELNAQWMAATGRI